MKLEALGCQCSTCPLRNAPGPVQPLVSANGQALLLLEHPRDLDIKERRPLQGSTGTLIKDSLLAIRNFRGSTSVAFAVACQPDNDDLNAAEAGWKRAKKLAKEDGGTAEAPAAGAASAVAACRPQWRHLLATHRNVIAAGATSWNALTGQDSGTSSISGAPFFAVSADVTVPQPLTLITPGHGHPQVVPPAATHRVIPAISPSLAVFKRGMRIAWDSVVRRSAMFFEGSLAFSLPKDTILTHGNLPGCSPAELEDFFNVPDPENYWWSDDIETEHSKYTPARSRLQCRIYLFGVTRIPKQAPRLDDPRAATRVFAFRDLAGAKVHLPTVTKTVEALLARVLQDPRYAWVGQNAGNFEASVYAERLGVPIGATRRVDTKVLHWADYPGLPHTLEFIGSTLTDAPAWKADFHAGKKLADIANVGSMTQWIEYNALDTAVTVVAAVPLQNRAGQRALPGGLTPEWKAQQAVIDAGNPLPLGVRPYPFRKLSDLWNFKQQSAVHLQRAGLPIDTTVIRALYQLLQHEAAYYLTLVQQHLGAGLNPNSSTQIAKVLFGAPPTGWGLEPVVLTDSGAPSTSDDALKELLREGLDGRQVAGLRAVILYRRVTAKWIGTYIWPLHPDNPDRVPYDSPIYAGRQYIGTEYAGTVYPPRLRASWNSEGTPVNRFASSDPMNLQTIPGGGYLNSFKGELLADWLELFTSAGVVVKDIPVTDGVITGPVEINFRRPFRAPPGFVMGGADADQAHLRIAASLWGIEKLLKAFAVGGCPHAIATQLIMGDGFRQLPGFPKLRDDSAEAREFFILAEGQKWKGAAKAARQTGKTFQYTALYEGAAHAIAVVLWGMESPDGALPLLIGDQAGRGRLSLRQVQAFRRNWLRGMPEFEQGWESTIKECFANREREAKRLKTDLLLTPAFLHSPVSGQRMDFWGDLTGEEQAAGEVENDRNKAINFKVLESEQAIMQAALHRAVNGELPWEICGPGTGTILQVHDSLTGMLPETFRGATGDSFDMAPGDAVERKQPGRSARENTGKWLADYYAECITTNLLTLPGVIHSGSGCWGDTLADA